MHLSLLTTAESCHCLVFGHGVGIRVTTGVIVVVVVITSRSQSRGIRIRRGVCVAHHAVLDGLEVEERGRVPRPSPTK